MHGSIRFAVVLLLTISWLSYTIALVCSPDFCSFVNCSNKLSKDDCNKEKKEYRPNSTICGCCSSCIDYIPVGGNCTLSPSLTMKGTPIIIPHCTPGSRCSEVENRCVCDQSDSDGASPEDSQIK